MPDLNSQTRLHRRFNGRSQLDKQNKRVLVTDCAFCFFPFLTVAVCSLKDLKIFVPEAVIMGNAATLSCQFELEKVSQLSEQGALSMESVLCFATSH